MFRLTNVVDNISLDVNAHFKLKKMKFFTNKDKQHRFENKGICGIIINCSSPSTATRAVSSYNANKKSKTSYQNRSSYHRWFLCADAMNPPHTFAIVTQTHQQTCDLLQHVHESSFMGMAFYLVEPNLSTSRVGDYLHIIDMRGQTLYPLRTSARVLKKPAPIELPNSSEQTFYFVLEGEQINLTMMKYSTNTCTGYQCDRHWGKDGCVCAFGSMGNSLVYEFFFEIPVDKRQFSVDSQVAPISSFRTMSVFFNNLVEYTHASTGPKEAKVYLRRRSQIRRMIRYINGNGGWKIIGWCKRGLLSIDGEADKVENREVNLRLSYVYPQNEDIFRDPFFKSLRIKEDFDLSDIMLENMDLMAHDSSDDTDDSDDSDKEGYNTPSVNGENDGNGDQLSDEETDGGRSVQPSLSTRSGTETTTSSSSSGSAESGSTSTSSDGVSNARVDLFPDNAGVV